MQSKLKENIILGLFISYIVLSGILAFVDFRITAVLLVILYIFLIIFIIAREKKLDLIVFTSAIGFSLFIVSLFISAFLPHDLNNWASLFQILGTLFWAIAGLINSRKLHKIGDVFKAEFAHYFKNWKITLLQDNLNKRKSGTVKKADWLIKYNFGKQDDKEYLEVYAVNPRTWDRHFQILENGERVKLPALDDLQGVTEAQLTAELKAKDLYPLNLNSWLVSYITQNRHSKSRYEIDKFLLESGYGPGDIEKAWDSLAPTAK